MPTAVLFDFGGTLDADGLTWKERVQRLYRDEGVPVAADHFDDAFYAADDALVGMIGRSLPFRETVGRLVAGVARGLGIDDEAMVQRVGMRFTDDAVKTLRRNRCLLEALGRRYRLGVVSNFYGNLASVCEEYALGPLLGAVIDSAEVGIRKPDPAIFRIGLEALAVGAADAVFVGDSAPRDMAGARAAGLPHVWLVADRAGRAMPCCPGDRVIRALSDLEAILL